MNETSCLVETEGTGKKFWIPAVLMDPQYEGDSGTT